jgi:hypothetical protein
VDLSLRASDEAVTENPEEDIFRLIRGVALALNGKSVRAIQDFEWLQNRPRSGPGSPENQLCNQIEGRVQALKEGKNLFGPEVMKQLEAWLNQ